MQTVRFTQVSACATGLAKPVAPSYRLDDIFYLLTASGEPLLQQSDRAKALVILVYNAIPPSFDNSFLNIYSLLRQSLTLLTQPHPHLLYLGRCRTGRILSVLPSSPSVTHVRHIQLFIILFFSSDSINGFETERMPELTKRVSMQTGTA
jgi:hypothetical protein